MQSFKIKKSKLCKKCNQILLLSEFYKHKSYKDGYRNICKKCDNSNRIKNKRLVKKRQQSLHQESFLDTTHFHRLEQEFVTSYQNWEIEVKSQKLKEMYEVSRLLAMDKKQYFAIKKFTEETEGLINYELAMIHKLPILPKIETLKIADKTILIMPQNQCIPLDIQDAIRKKLNL